MNAVSLFTGIGGFDLGLEAYAWDADWAALQCRCQDAPRYRELGNAVTVTVAEWLGRRLVTA